jgi:glycosyltransferase involved in cell wall biosynthesis
MSKTPEVKLIFWTDIATPYRTSFYNKLQRNNLSFTVWYMEPCVPSRPWKIHEMDIQHKFMLVKGFYLRIRNFNLFINLKLILWSLFLNKNDNIILALSWNDPNVIILSLLKRVGILRTQISFWSEANYLTNGARNDNKLKYLFRRFIYKSTDGVQLSSGRMTELTFKLWGVENQRYIKLPNTIEEERFYLTDTERLIRANMDVPVIVIVARLIENIKGILNFFKSIGIDRIKKVKIIIAGDGPDRLIIEQYITKNFLQDYILLAGDLNVYQLRLTLAKANIFCLPSFTDASPLSLIEALKMDLPLLISERCGNHFESVISGVNGFTFNPDSVSSVCNAFDSIIKVKHNLVRMGQESGNLYRSNFSLNYVVENFIEQININNR